MSHSQCNVEIPKMVSSAPVGVVNKNGAIKCDKLTSQPKDHFLLQNLYDWI